MDTALEDTGPAAPVRSDSAFPEELPPDFWDSEPVGVNAQPDTNARPRAPLEASYGGAAQSVAEANAGGLESNPRFQVMQTLFPGRVLEWHEVKAETPEDDSETTEEDPQDTVNLESDES